MGFPPFNPNWLISGGAATPLGFYIEGTVSSLPNDPAYLGEPCFGICDELFNLISTNSTGINLLNLGSDTHECMFYSFHPSEHSWGQDVGMPGVPTTARSGDTYGLAVSTVYKRIWTRNCTLTPGTWYGASGTGDPTTNTGGADISGSLTGSQLYILGGSGATQPGHTNSAGLILNAGASTFVAAPPDLYPAWDVSGATVWNPADIADPGPIIAPYPSNVITAASWTAQFLPPLFNNTSYFTFGTAAPHAISVGDLFVITGMAPTAYNGSFFAIAGTTGSTLVALRASNPGPATILGLLAGGGETLLGGPPPPQYNDGVANFARSTTFKSI